jgi:[ribosomal protein S5]-alanine N-acetyltransferase
MITGPAVLRLEGAKVDLWTFTRADITQEYVSWLNDPLTMRYSNQRFLRHDTASSERYLAGFAGSPNHFLTIRRRDNARTIGTMTAYVSTHHGTADMGILVGDRTAWGQGFGQDAWDTLLQWLLAQPGMRKVTAGTLACNAAMLRLVDRSGMQLEARRREQELVDGRAEDVLYFARFRT